MTAAATENVFSFEEITRWARRKQSGIRFRRGVVLTGVQRSERTVYHVWHARNVAVRNQKLERIDIHVKHTKTDVNNRKYSLLTQKSVLGIERIEIRD